VLHTSLSTEYYPVRGTTAAAIFEEIDRNGLVEKSGQRAIGLTSVDWKLASDGPCNAPSLTITLRVVVTLPRHEQPEVLRADVRRHWERFAARVAAHEQRHVDIFLDGAKALKASMETPRAKGASCAEVEKVVDELWTRGQAEIDRAQEQFHVEDGARSKAERGPMQADLDQLIAAIDDLIEGLNWTP
jgi:predicted secreted Zn-dependent protease